MRGFAPADLKVALLSALCAALIVGAMPGMFVAQAGNGQKLERARAAVVEAYNPDARSATVYRTGISAADTSSTAATNAGIGTVTTFTVHGQPTISVTPYFSDASESVTVAYVGYFTGVVGGTFVTDKLVYFDVSSSIAGTSVLYTDGSSYTGGTWLFDSGGATHCKVIVTTAPSSGTVGLDVGSY